MKKFQLTLTPLIFILASLFLLVLPASSHAQTSASTPNWPIQLLTVEDREELIKFFLSIHKYNPTAHGENASPSECSKIWDSFSRQNVKVLAPRYTDNIEGEALSVPAGKNNSKVTECQGFSHFSSGAEKNGLLQNQNKAAETDDYTELPTANFEYYDLSEYLGSNVWGFSGEGIIRQCTTAGAQYCSASTGYMKFVSGTTGLVFNSTTCDKNYLHDWGYVSRLYFNGGCACGVADNPCSKPCAGDHYYEAADFTAYVLIDNVPHSVAVYSDGRWSRFASVAGRKGRTIITLQKLSATSNHTAQPNFCEFSSASKDSK